MLNEESPLDFDFDFNNYDHLSYGLSPALLSAQQANVSDENAGGDLVGPQDIDHTTTEVGVIEFYSDQAHELGLELSDFTDATPARSNGCDDEDRNGNGSEHRLAPQNNPDVVCYGMVSCNHQ